MIQELIEAKVNAMTANSMTYSFLHADVEWQNLKADNDILPAVFMDMPVLFNPVVKVGGAYERKYSVNVLFLFKSNLDDSAEQRYDSLKLAENAQRQFHLMVDQDNTNFKGVEVGQCFQVMNFLDCNLDGIVMPFSFTERNSDSVCAPASDQVCKPVAYSINDTDGNILYSGIVASGGTLIKAIQDGQVKNSLGTVLGSILAEGELVLDDVDNIDSDGSTVPTPAGVAFTCTPVAPCADAELTLNTDAFLTVASGSTTDISLIDQDDNDITPLSVIGSAVKVNIPSIGWQRPTEWEAIPTISTGEEVIYMLMAVFNLEGQGVAFSVTGKYNVDWGDGVVEAFTSGANAIHFYDYSTMSGTPTSGGFKQAMIKVTPQAGQNLTSLTFSVLQTGYGYQKPVYILDLVMNVPNMSWLQLFYGTQQLASMCERVWIKESALTYLQNGFQYMYKVQSIPVFDISNVTGSSNWFQDCRAIQKIEAFDFTNFTSFNNMFHKTHSLLEVNAINTGNVASWVSAFNTSSACIFDSLDFSGCTTISDIFDSALLTETFIKSTPLLTDISYSFYANLTLREIDIDASNITNTAGAFAYSYNIQSVKLRGMTVGFSVANTKMSATALDEMFTLLGTASGAQNIDVSGTTGAGTCDTSIATSKGFTVTT